jgi:FkbM family methyltransferase
MEKIMSKLKGFDWGWMATSNKGEYHKDLISKDIKNKAYEQFFEVEENDIVLDCGSSIGPFSYSILQSKPKRIVCVEPSKIEIPTLINNLSSHDNFTLVPFAISDIDGEKELFHIFGTSEEDSSKVKTLVKTIKFQTLINTYNLKHIDFLKTDCEGGEYDIFNSENIWWIKDNIKKISGEWHLGNQKLKEKFRVFRDTYLRLFPNYKVTSIDGVDIGWDLWNEHFIEYYNEVFIYIDNR